MRAETRRRYRGVLALVALLGLAVGLLRGWGAVPDLPERAAAPPPRLETARVAGVIDGDTLRLAEGPELRLTGIAAPRLPLGRPDVRTQPHGKAARAALARLAPPGTRLDLSYGGRAADRHRRLLAQARRARDGLWLQGEMVRRGHARVYGFADNRGPLRALLSRERAARAAGRGLWAHERFAIRRAGPGTGPGTGPRGSFQIVEGRARAVARPGETTYINFGPDYRTDFTLGLDEKARARFEASGLDPESLAGRRLRVRGWIRAYNGPFIDVTHPEQIEILDSAVPTGAAP